MKKLLVIPLVLTVFLVLAATAKEASTVNGWVTDSKCGVKGANAAHAACAKKCLGEGAKVAFVPDGTKDVLIVDNPDTLKGHEAHHVTVTGNINEEKKTIHVDSVKMMAQGSESSNNTPETRY